MSESITKQYPLFKAHIPIESALANIKEVFESGYVNEGKQVTLLTSKLSDYFGTQNIILLNSCTSAITLALTLAGVKQGDDVITTSMTCVATNTPIVALGANIVWADIDPNTGMLDSDSVESKITNATKAVIVVAWAGSPPNLVSLFEVCQKHKVKLILDAAHAFGAKLSGQNISEYADYTCYSFQAIKHITTGDGGALICKNDDDHKRSKALKWFGLDRDKAKDEKGDWKGQQWDVDIVEAGYKFNMNNLSAAIGLAQIKHIDTVVGTHRRNAARYHELLCQNKKILLPTLEQAVESSFWVYTIQLLDSCAQDRDRVVEKLNQHGIMAGLVHVPNDSYTAFEKYKCDLPNTKLFADRQFSIPCGWWLTADDVEYIAATVISLIQ